VNNAPVTLWSNGSITNPGTVNSEPVLFLMGNGNITLAINGISIQLTGISGSITIDSVLKDAYNGSTLLNNQMLGDFPVFLPGVNTISWTGSVSSLHVTPNWRWL